MALDLAIPPDAPLLEVEHVAHRLRFSREHVRELLRAGHLVGARLGKSGTRWRVDEVDLRAYIARGKTVNVEQGKRA